jgi:hypothetical protein
VMGPAPRTLAVAAAESGVGVGTTSGPPSHGASGPGSLAGAAAGAASSAAASGTSSGVKARHPTVAPPQPQWEVAAACSYGPAGWGSSLQLLVHTGERIDWGPLPGENNPFCYQ